MSESVVIPSSRARSAICQTLMMPKYTRAASTNAEHHGRALSGDHDAALLDAVGHGAADQRQEGDGMAAAKRTAPRVKAELLSWYTSQPTATCCNQCR